VELQQQQFIRRSSGEGAGYNGFLAGENALAKQRR
jgi:hypothetical protein